MNPKFFIKIKEFSMVKGTCFKSFFRFGAVMGLSLALFVTMLPNDAAGG